MREILKLFVPSICGKVLRKVARLSGFDSKAFQQQKKRVPVHGVSLSMPFEHALPGILRETPNYELEIVRGIQYLLHEGRKPIVVDVGANIGDTVASIPERDRAEFLCIEGSPYFFEFLKENFGNAHNVRMVNAMVTDPEGERNPVQAQFSEKGGTAQVIVLQQSASEGALPQRTLDSILADFPDFQKCNFLKIDTDGYDYKVLLGSETLLKTSKPIVHFELMFTWWRQFGNSNWRDAAKFLSDLGYNNCLLYDNLGYLIDTERLDAPRLLPSLEPYGLRRKLSFYVNVLAFHDDDSLWDGFKAVELRQP